MNLYILKPVLIDNQAHSKWEPWFDSSSMFIVNAIDETQARLLVLNTCECEDKTIWLDSVVTSCNLFVSTNIASVIITNCYEN